MRLTVGLLTCLAVIALSQVHAADPTPQSSPAAAQPAAAAATSSSDTAAAGAPAAPPSTATAAPASASTAAPTSATAQSDKDAVAELDRRLIKEGYKVTQNRGEKYYCRNEAIVGTRFERKVCITADEMVATQQKAQDDVSRLQKRMQADKGG